MKYCTNCGKELKEGADFCTGCGVRIEKLPLNNTNKIVKTKEKYNALSVAGFVISAVSLFLNFKPFPGILSIVLSSVGLYQISKTNEKGKSLAIIGLILGIINTIYGLLYLFEFYSYYI